MDKEKSLRNLEMVFDKAMNLNNVLVMIETIIPNVEPSLQLARDLVWDIIHAIQPELEAALLDFSIPVTALAKTIGGHHVTY